MGASSKLTWSLTIAALIAVLGAAAVVPAQQRRLAGYAWDEPGWRFQYHDRRVKVTLLAGSIGAFRDRPYGRLLHEQCENVEIRNLSVVGAGALQLVSHFEREVLENRNLPIGSPHNEMWLLFGGGMNSVGIPHRTNRAMARLFRHAHQRHIRVAALTLTPWGTTPDEDERWQGAGALHAMRSTRTIVDFVMGRNTPAEALGPSADRAAFREEERPDVAIDLYDSPLRDRDAQPWPLDEVRRSLSRDARWRTWTADLSEEARAARLEHDAQLVSEAPRWFLRREYRSFDHIHPNRAGHAMIAQIACPHLPESWGCRCATPEESP